MKRYFGVLAAGALAACSSSSNNNGTAPPPLGNFTYGTPQAASQNSTQYQSANNAQQTTTPIVTGATTGSASSASDAPFLADDISGTALGARAVPPGPAYSVVGKIADARRSGSLDNTNCLVETATSITYNMCTITSTGFNETFNGTLSVTSNSVTWNLTYSGTFTSSGETSTENGAWKGTITVNGTDTDGVVTGNATSTFSGNFVASGTSENYAYTAGVDLINLTYTSACINAGGFFVSGVLEVRRNVAETGTFTAPLQTAAIEFTWTGCNAVSYAVGSGG